MCFIIDHDHPNALIAKKDIVCYKQMYTIGVGEIRIFRSPFFNFEYKFDKLYELEKPCELYEDQEPGLIHRGFHSYAKLQTARNLNTCNRIITQCIIPQGAEYYVNNYDDEYVSNKIIIKKVITEN